MQESKQKVTKVAPLLVKPGGTFTFNLYFHLLQLMYVNVKKIAFGNKEHTKDQKMGVSVLLRHFISSNEVCNTTYAL